jgi:hypothetical protein
LIRINVIFHQIALPSRLLAAGHDAGDEYPLKNVAKKSYLFVTFLRPRVNGRSVREAARQRVWLRR